MKLTFKKCFYEYKIYNYFKYTIFFSKFLELILEKNKAKK